MSTTSPQDLHALELKRMQFVMNMKVADLLATLRQRFTQQDDAITYYATEVMDWMAHSDPGTARKLPTTPGTTPRHIAASALAFAIETTIDLMPEQEDEAGIAA